MIQSCMFIMYYHLLKIVYSEVDVHMSIDSVDRRFWVYNCWCFVLWAVAYVIQVLIYLTAAVVLMATLAGLAILWYVDPRSHPELFNREIEGSLFHILSVVTLSMLRKAGQPGLIPIKAVYDMAIDPSGPARDFKGLAVVYMWTRKTDGMQYVGSTINAGNLFGKTYNSPASMMQHPTYFTSNLLADGPALYCVTIIMVTPPITAILWPMETLWIHIMDSQFNISLIGGSSAVQRVNHWTVAMAARLSAAASARLSALRTNPLAPWLGQSNIGANNPFFGKTHSVASTDSMSAAKGSRTYAYLVLDNGSLEPLASATSATRLATALVKLGYAVSRPTVVKYTALFDTNQLNHVYSCPMGRIIFTGYPQ